MPAEPTDFALEEYRQLWQLYRLFYEAQHKVVAYLSAALSVVLTVVYTRLGEDDSPDAALLLGVVWILGLLGLVYLIHLRHQMVRHVKMINVIRAYFAADHGHQWSSWCRLPRTECEPRFWGKGRAHIWFVAPIIFLNSVVGGAAVWAASGLLWAVEPLGGAAVAFFVSAVAMFGCYRLCLLRFDKTYRSGTED